MASNQLEQFDRGKVIGAGGFGTVYLGTKVSDGSQVALKTISKTDEGFNSATMLREAELLQRLNHPNILRFEALEELDGEFVIVTEYLAGGELYQRLREEQYLSEGIAKDVVKQIVSALCHAHEIGLVHRDIKPENIMYTRAGESQIKVIDWGTGRPLPPFDPRMCLEMSVDVGTVGYAAPEVFSDMTAEMKYYTQACDLWSVGVLTLEMLTGEQPFFGIYDAATLCKGYELVDPALLDKLSPLALDFIKKLIVGNPELRMTAADALLHPWLVTPSPEDTQLLTTPLKHISARARRRQRDQLSRSLTRDASNRRYIFSTSSLRFRRSHDPEA